MAAEMEINNHQHNVTRFTPNELIQPNFVDATDAITGDTIWKEQMKKLTEIRSRPSSVNNKRILVYERIEKEKLERYENSKPVRERDLWYPEVGQEVLMKL